jgi:hypothetical protein
MRACRYCQHQNADHLGYCSQCGRRMGPVTGVPGALGTAGAGDGNGGGAPRGPSGNLMVLPDAMSRTVLAPAPGGGDRPSGALAAAGGDEARAPSSSTWLGWLAGSVGYIYVFLRGKLDAGERRRRLIEERDGAGRLLTGAVKELGLTVLAQGIQHPDLTGLLEAIGRAEARRESAAADIAASEQLQQAEQARLSAQEAALDAEWNACDRASREADELTRGVSGESQSAASRLAKLRDQRARLEREADAADAGSPQRAAHLRHEADGLRTEESALEEQVARLDAQLVEMRQRSAALRTAAQGGRAKLDEAIATRRSAGSAMSATIVGHGRERAEAEREVADLTEQLGRAAAQARSTAPLLMPLYQRIDRLQETLSDRASQIAALDRAAAHYDQKKLLTGVGLVTSMLVALGVVLWAVLK